MKHRFISIVGVCMVLLILSCIEYNLLQSHYEFDTNKMIHNNCSSQQIPIQMNTDDEMKSPKLYALSACLMDADSNRVLYEKDGYTKRAMASTTKIMTCIIVLENANLDDIVTISSYAAAQPDVQLNMKAEDQYYLKDLLYSLMLESHNDTAVAIAEHVGGSVGGFAAMMNQKAKELGCMDTNFVTPNGLDATNHYTTAKDLAVIASYAIQNKEFIQITNTPSYQFQEITEHKQYSVTNKDRFLYLMEGAIGVKTGFTNQAGYCFVGAVRRNGKTFVSVVLGSGWPPNKTYKWSDTTKLMNYGLDHYEKKEINVSEKTFEPIYVVNGKEPYVNATVTGEFSLLIHAKESLVVQYSVPDCVEAPVAQNSKIGTANYYIDGQLVCSYPILTTTSVEQKDYQFCLEDVFSRFMMDYE